MAITKHNPFTEVEEFPTFRLFQDTVNRLLAEPQSSRPWAPAVDILETENELLLKADLPGVEMKNIDIQVENSTLTLKGQREFQNEAKQGGYHRIERSYGRFMRSFAVPNSVDTEKVSADYKDGVLTVALPKKEAAKARQVKVEEKKSH